MKILLIMPDGRINKLKAGPIDISFREAPLTLTTLAALVPEELNAEIKIIDMSVGQSVPFDEEFDIVGISLMTGTSLEGYKIAEKFRKMNVTVVLGGIHTTLLPEEASLHADVVVTGFAEKIWPLLLHDFNNGKLKKKYHEDGSHIDNLPMPRRDLQKKFGYMMPNTVFVTRGCRGKCDFCSVPAAGFGWHKRSVGDVIDEMKKIDTRRIAISDVHLTDDVEYAKELFTAMIPLRKKWGALASTRVVNDPELLDLMQKSGCAYLLLGFESFNPSSLKRMSKAFNEAGHYREVVNKLHDKNILIQGCFIFGFDEDGPEIFENTIDFVNHLKIDIPRYAIYTPYPKTRLFHRLEKKGRILHKNWYYYDTQHVVFKPLKMSPRELDEGFKRAYKNTFTTKSSLIRSLSSGWNMPITFLGNLAYKLYIKRLYNDSNRFPETVNSIIDTRFLAEKAKENLRKEVIK